MWEDEAAENDAKLRATINSIASDHDLDRFNMQKDFKNAIAAKNAEIYELATEFKRVKYLLSQYSAENKELHKKLENAHRTIDALRGGSDNSSEHSGHSVPRSSKPLNPDAAIFGEGKLFSSDLSSGSSFGTKPLPPSSAWEGHSGGHGIHSNLDSTGDALSGHHVASERSGSMADFGGLFSPSPTLSPFSPPSPGDATKPPPPAAAAAAASNSTVPQQKFPTASSSTTLMLGGGRFVVDGDREGPVFLPGEEPDMGPPPGFQSASSPPAPPARATSRLAGVDTGNGGGGGVGEDLQQTDEQQGGGEGDETGALLTHIRLQAKSSKLDARPVDSSGPGASPLSSPSGSHTAM